MSITVTNADMLAKYSPRQYKDNTVRTYVSALEKAPTVFREPMSVLPMLAMSNTPMLPKVTHWGDQ